MHHASPGSEYKAFRTLQEAERYLGAAGVADLSFVDELNIQPREVYQMARCGSTAQPPSTRSSQEFHGYCKHSPGEASAVAIIYGLHHKPILFVRQHYQRAHKAQAMAAALFVGVVVRCSVCRTHYAQWVPQAARNLLGIRQLRACCDDKATKILAQGKNRASLDAITQSLYKSVDRWCEDEEQFKVWGLEEQDDALHAHASQLIVDHNRFNRADDYCNARVAAEAVIKHPAMHGIEAQGMDKLLNMPLLEDVAKYVQTGTLPAHTRC